MILPNSHKSNLIHPAFEGEEGNKSLEDVEGAVEVHYKAGDALFFVDCCAHGSAERVTDGERRIVIIRYGPHWGWDRYGYQPSPELIARLTPERRKIVQPLPPKMPPEQPSIYDVAEAFNYDRQN
jgi:ectoine hydroxylase-related dioxygenase (phytanoyl-CoA dioxygenase family)